MINGSQRPANEGYHAGTISVPNVAFNPAGDPAGFDYGGNPFDLNSAYLTTAFGNSLPVRVQGYGASVAYDNTYLLNSTNASLINFNYLNVTYVRFTSASSIFVLENLTVTHTNGQTAADFSASSTFGQAPLGVQFLDNAGPVGGHEVAGFDRADSRSKRDNPG